MALYFWIIGDPHTYADGCAYTVSCIFSTIWLIDLYKNHRQTGPILGIGDLSNL